MIDVKDLLVVQTGVAKLPPKTLGQFHRLAPAARPHASTSWPAR